MLKDKRGEMQEVLYWFFYIPLTATVVIMLAVSSSSLVNNISSTHDLEYNIYSTRALNALSYRDIDTGRLYFGILDHSKLEEEKTEEILKKVLDDKEYNGVEFGIKIELKYLDDSGKEQVFYYNKENYDISKIFQFFKRDRFVLIKSEEGLIPAKLSIKTAFHKNKYPGES